jgi:acyl carrier protein
MPGEITERVIQVIAKHQRLDSSLVRPDSTFEQLGIDSLDGLQILFELEEEFSINIPDDVAREFRSIDQAIQCVTSQLDHKPVQA